MVLWWRILILAMCNFWSTIPIIYIDRSCNIGKCLESTGYFVLGPTLSMLSLCNTRVAYATSLKARTALNLESALVTWYWFQPNLQYYDSVWILLHVNYPNLWKFAQNGRRFSGGLEQSKLAKSRTASTSRLEVGKKRARKVRNIKKMGGPLAGWLQGDPCE